MFSLLVDRIVAVHLIGARVDPFVLYRRENAVASKSTALFDQRYVVLGHFYLRWVLSILFLDLFIRFAQLDLNESKREYLTMSEIKNSESPTSSTHLGFEELSIDFAAGHLPRCHVFQMVSCPCLLLLLLLLLFELRLLVSECCTHFSPHAALCSKPRPQNL